MDLKLFLEKLLLFVAGHHAYQDELRVDDPISFNRMGFSKDRIFFLPNSDKAIPKHVGFFTKFLFYFHAHIINGKYSILFMIKFVNSKDFTHLSPLFPKTSIENRI